MKKEKRLQRLLIIQILSLSLVLNSCYSSIILKKEYENKFETNINEKKFKYIFTPFIENINLKNKELEILLLNTPVYEKIIEEKKISSKNFNFLEYSVSIIIDIFISFLFIIPFLKKKNINENTDFLVDFFQKNPENILYTISGLILIDFILSIFLFIPSSITTIKNEYIKKIQESNILQNTDCHIFWNNKYMSFKSNDKGKIKLPIDDNFNIDNLNGIEIKIDFGESSKLDIKNSINQESFIFIVKYRINQEYYNNAIAFSQKNLFNDAIDEISKIDQDEFIIKFNINKKIFYWKNQLENKKIYDEAINLSNKGLYDEAIDKISKIDQDEFIIKFNINKKIFYWKNEVKRINSDLKNKTFKEEYDNAYKFAYKNNLEGAIHNMKMISKESPNYKDAQLKIKEWGLLLNNKKYEEIYQESISLFNNDKRLVALKKLKEIPSKSSNYSKVKKEINKFEKIIFNDECEKKLKYSENLNNKDITKEIIELKKISKNCNNYNLVKNRIKSLELKESEDKKEKIENNKKGKNLKYSKGILGELEKEFDLNKDGKITGSDWVYIDFINKKAKETLIRAYYISLWQTSQGITPPSTQTNEQVMIIINDLDNYYNNSNNLKTEVLNAIYETSK